MSRITYNDIFYLNCPYMIVGREDQWFSQGYLYHEGHVYEFHEDRKDQWGETYNKQTVEEFMKFANDQNIEIPEDFKKSLQIS